MLSVGDRVRVLTREELAAKWRARDGDAARIYPDRSVDPFRDLPDRMATITKVLASDDFVWYEIAEKPGHEIAGDWFEGQWTNLKHGRLDS